MIWRQHRFRANRRIELPGADEPRGERLFPQARSIKMRGLGDPRRFVVADPWRKRGDKHQGLPHQFIDPLPLRGKPLDAVAPETVHGVGEEDEAFEERGCDDVPIDVELEMTLRSPTAWSASR
jgi:hypothetical protein